MTETLERRRLLSASIQGSVLLANATSGDDAIELKRVGGDDVLVTIWSGASTPASSQVFDMDDFHGVRLNGGFGNDVLYFSGSGIVPAVTMDGGFGDDTFYGGNADETIMGNQGNDLLWGGGGDDRLEDGLGVDEVHWDGLDSGDTIVFASEHGDVVLAPGGTLNFLTTTATSITATGTDSNDRFYVNAGFNGAENLIKIGHNGNFRTQRIDPSVQVKLVGLNSNDFFDFDYEDYNDDEIGPFKPVIVEGGDGDDHVREDEGFNTVQFHGGAGSDIAESIEAAGSFGFASGGSGIDTVITLQGGVDLRDQSDVENAVSQGDIYGNALNNRLELRNAGGTRRIFAGDGNDTLTSSDSDALYGEGGDDLFDLNDSNDDFIDGGAGTDRITGSKLISDRVVNVELYPAPAASIGHDDYPSRELVVFGTIKSDVIELARVGLDDVRITVWVNGAASTSLVRTFDMDNFDQLRAFSGSGNDTVYVANGAAIQTVATSGLGLYGNAGNDTIIGSSGYDVLQGGTGRDNLAGIAGNDNLGNNKDSSPDTVNGGGGNDFALIDQAIDSVSGVETVTT